MPRKKEKPPTRKVVVTFIAEVPRDHNILDVENDIVQAFDDMIQEGHLPVVTDTLDWSVREV